MKTIAIYISLFYLLFQFHSRAQVNPYRMDGCVPVKSKTKISDQKQLMPVYFNYTKRQLFYNGTMRLSGNEFLNMCRGINDQQVQLQIERYDKLTSNKKKLLGAMVACGVTGYVTMYSSILFTSSNYNRSGSYVTTGIGAFMFFVATPLIAISTSIPHQKRKEVLFRDLPAAYNFYIETNNSK